MKDSETLESPSSLRVMKVHNFLPWVPRFIVNPLPNFAKFAKEEGGLIYMIGVSSQNLLVVTDPEWIRFVLKDREASFSRRPILYSMSHFLGEGLLRSEGEYWQKMQQHMKPAFHDKQVYQYMEVLEQEIQKLLDAVTRESAGGRAVDIEPLCSKLMVTIMCKSLFCAEIEYPIEEILAYHTAIIQENRFLTIKRQWLAQKMKKAIGLNPTLRPSSALIKLDAIVADIRQRAQGRQSFLLGTLEKLAEAGEIPDKQVRDEMMNLIFAGFDTIAAALSWSLFAAASYPESLKPVLEEIADWKSRLPDANSLGKMTEMRFFLQECLRMFPPVWSMYRESKEAITFYDRTLSDETAVMINIYGVHHSEEIWGDPETFRPHRFKPEEFRGKSFAYLPFGHGARICIGKPMAMTECQLILTRLLNAGTWGRLDHRPVHAQSDIIRKAKKGLWLTFTPSH